MIQTICSCGERYEVRDDLAGKKVRCVACSATMYVPGRRPSAPTHAAAARPGGPSRKSERAHPPETPAIRASSLVAGAIAGFLAIAVAWVVLSPAAPAPRPATPPVAHARLKAAPEASRGVELARGARP
ncbi:MAG TPA: hypothetical protein VHF22_00330 [Planctomycetota bacterium]|nr:hypothetical protein [Planctomycetota bacterium]